MIWKSVILLVLGTMIEKVSAQHTISSLEEFTRSLNTSLVVELQENPYFLSQVVVGLINDIKAFIMSNFGYNRYALGEAVNKVLTKIDKLPQSKNGTGKNEPCISKNKDIMFFLVKEATLDWSCLEGQLYSTFHTATSIIKSLNGLVSIPGSDCNLGILCFITKGFSGVSLGASLSTNLVSLGLTITNFLSSVRRCQKKVENLEDVLDISLNNIDRCIAMKSK